MSLPGNPTGFLPPLGQIAKCSPAQITSALNHLRLLYWPLPPSAVLQLRKRAKQTHLIHDDSVPDSGYVSQSEDEDDEGHEECEEDADEGPLDIIRADAYERTFAVQWLTCLVTRSDKWLSAGSGSEDEDERYALLDETTALLSAFAGRDIPEEAITRKFSFPVVEGVVEVELNDAPVTGEDHTCVGLQSWASSIVLATRLCADPAAFGLAVGHPRILELGAGTGLLSIVAKKLLPAADIFATDYHPDVLANCVRNMDTNFPSPSSATVAVEAFDWEHPSHSTPFDRPFDIILAADVVYHPDHARWIKPCVERLLQPGGRFWMIVALRATGRHEGLIDMVDDVFPGIEAVTSGEGCVEAKLAVLRTEVFERMDGMGRADEGGYKSFEIGWVQC